MYSSTHTLSHSVLKTRLYYQITFSFYILHTAFTLSEVVTAAKLVYEGTMDENVQCTFTRDMNIK